MFERGEKYLNSIEKRGLDIAVSGVALVLTVPLIGCLALGKYIEDGEYPFFIQERMGKGGEMMKIIKIRSMRCGNEPDDVRVTKFGKWLRKTHLDELPQFWLVFKGEMSLVGVRPLITEGIANIYDHVSTLDRYEQIIGDYKELKGSLTGIWEIARKGPKKDHQIYHPNRFYIKNASLFLDLKIGYKTAQKILKSLI